MNPNEITEASNYKAVIVTIDNVREHTNADRLNCTNIFFNNIIIAKTTKIGDIGVYFPLECQLSQEFCDANDLIRRDEIVDGVKKKAGGMFDANRRVRAQGFRGEKSMGFWIEAVALKKWAEHAGFELPELKPGDEFDSLHGHEICRKYVNEKARNASLAKKKGKVKRVSRIIENQFRLADDTAQLKRNIHKISPDDLITISFKMHGTNANYANVLCKRPLKLYEKVLKFLGVKINDVHYDLIISSRRVIKNKYADEAKGSFYDEDIWMRAAEKIRPALKPGISAHCEIVGQLSNGKWIQKGYDYGTNPGEFEVYVYRMFYTSVHGDVYEFTTPKMVKYCQEMGLKTVPIFYYGYARDLYPELDTEDHWHEDFLAKLIKDYTEKDCYMSKNVVPEEGICVIKNCNNFEALKLKSFRFLERETKELDSGEVNIEDMGLVEELLE